MKGFEHERAEGTLPPELSIGVAIHVARMFVADVAGTVAIEADAKNAEVEQADAKESDSQ